MIAEKVAPELGKKRIAVVDFLDSTGNLTELGKFIGEEVYMTLVNQSKRYKCRVLNRKHVNRLLEEHKIALSGLADPETAAQFGRFTLANVIITGTLAEFGEDRIRVSVSALSVDTAEVIKADRLSIVRAPSIDKLFKSKYADLDKQKVTELSPGDSAVPDRPKTIGKLKTATRPPLNEGGDTGSLMQA